MFIKSFHSGSDGKESAYNAGDLYLIPGLGRGNGNPLQYSCLQSSLDKELETYSPWGCKESDTTEQLTRIHVYQVSFRDCQFKRKRSRFGISLVVQRIRLHLPMQGTWVQSLVQEYFTCHRATKPLRHNY